MKFVMRVALVAVLVTPFNARPLNAATAPEDSPHIVFSTYLGDSRVDAPYDIAVAPDGTIVVVGAIEGSTVVRLSSDGSQILGRRTIAGADPRAVSVGLDGAIYIAGRTRGGLETVRPIQPTPHDGTQGFVAKVSADASQLLFCTYLGGSGTDGNADDVANDISVDSTGLAYVVGTTHAANNDFPLANPTQATFGGGYSDGFVSVIDADAPSLVFSTYFGDDGDDDVNSIALDPQAQTFCVQRLSVPNAAGRFGTPPDCDRAKQLLTQWRRASPEGVPLFIILYVEEYCAGVEYNDNTIKFYFPPEERVELIEVGSDVNTTGNAQQRVGGLDLRISVYDDKLKLLRTTLVGGPADEYPKRVTIDERGIIYIIGEADGVGLPTVDPFQAAFGGGGSDSFVAAFDSATLQPVFSSYIGGSGFDFPFGIALDADRNILLAGSTDSTNFPTTPSALHPVYGGGSDGWLTKISALGDLSPDFGVAVDPSAITAMRGHSGTLTVTIGRSGGFAGSVTVTAPDTKPIKVKLTPPTASTTGNTVEFKFKIKKKAVAGTHELVFTARDAQDRERTATTSLTIQ